MARVVNILQPASVFVMHLLRHKFRYSFVFLEGWGSQ